MKRIDYVWCASLWVVLAIFLLVFISSTRYPGPACGCRQYICEEHSPNVSLETQERE